MTQPQPRIRPRRWRLVALAAAVATMVGGLGQAPAGAAPLDVTVVDVTVTPTVADLASGFATLTLDLALQSDVPLADVLTGQFNRPATVGAARTDGRGPFDGAQLVMQGVSWGDLTRVAGTPTDGVWRGAVTVTRAWSGTWRLSRLSAYSFPAGTVDEDLTAFDVTLELGTGDLPPWKVEPAQVAPVRVVTGRETWTPRVRLTDRATGAGIAGFAVSYPYGDVWAPPRLGVDARLGRADSAGYWTGPAQQVPVNRELVGVNAYAGRGSRGYSLEAIACLDLLVKWQANERVALSGRTITVTGNAFPAPSIYAAANPGINLQVLTSGRWTTVAGSHVRANGRYTLTWQAPAAGTYQVRAYKPGGAGGGCGGGSVGVVLAAVPVSVR